MLATAKLLVKLHQQMGNDLYSQNVKHQANIFIGNLQQTFINCANTEHTPVDQYSADIEIVIDKALKDVMDGSSNEIQKLARS